MLVLNCQSFISREAFVLIQEVLQWIYILVPLLLLILIAFDYGKVVLGQDEKEIKKVTSRMLKRIVATFLAFLVPFLVNFLLTLPSVQHSLGEVGLLEDNECWKQHYMITERLLVKSGNTEVLMVLTPNFDYQKVKLPDGRVLTKEEQISYTATQNGTYIYIFYDENNEEITQIRYLVGTIDTKGPEGSCVYKQKEGMVQVTASDASGILGYSYYNGENYGSFIANHSSSVVKKLETMRVKVKDKLGNVTEMTCETIEPDLGTLEVHMIYSSSGDAMIIRSNSHVIMVDAGYASLAKSVVNYIKDLGITKIDAFISTHFHGDHIGGIPIVFQNFAVDKVYSPTEVVRNRSSYLDPIRSKNQRLKADDVLEFDEFTIKVVGPIEISKSCLNGYDCGNTDSLNFILTFGETRFLFTADYVQSENIIKRYGKEALTNVEFLKQPHHGLHNVISQQLIQIMRPSIVFIPDAKNHTNHRMRNWLYSVGAKLYHTYKSGNLLAISDGEKLTVYTKVVAKDYKR